MEHNQLCNVIIHAGMMLHRCSEWNTRATEYRLSPLRGQGKVLQLLSESTAPCRQRELAYQLDLSQQALCELLMKLEKKGLVIRESDSNDKRNVLISLTADGRAATEQLPPLQAQPIDPILCLTEEEQHTLEELLTRVSNHVASYLPQRRPAMGRGHPLAPIRPIRHRRDG